MIKDVQIGGIYYQIYYPDGVDFNNVSPDTQVAIYMHGGGSQSADSKDALNYRRRVRSHPRTRYQRGRYISPSQRLERQVCHSRQLSRFQRTVLPRSCLRG